MKIPRWSDWQGIDSLTDEPIPEEAQYCSSADVSKLEDAHARLIADVRSAIEKLPETSYWATEVALLLKRAIAKAEEGQHETNIS